jgi:hypothetical protein
MGTAGYVLTTNGANQTSWTDVCTYTQGGIAFGDSDQCLTEDASSLYWTSATSTFGVSGNNINLIGYTTIGDAGSTSRGLSADDDLFVSGKLEVDGTAYFDATNLYARTIVLGAGNLIYTSVAYGGFQPDMNAQTARSPGILTGVTGNLVIMCEYSDRGTDFGHTQQTNPTFFLHSADATDTTQWVSFTHNQTDGVIDVGTGKLTTPDAFQAADYYSGDGTQGITDSSSYWLCTSSDCTTTCQVTIKNGLIVGCP